MTYFSLSCPKGKALNLIYSFATVRRVAGAALAIRVKSRLIVDGDLFTGLNIAQRKENELIVHSSCKCIRGARVIDVVGTIPAAASVQTPAVVNSANAKDSTSAASLRFGVGNLFSGVGCDFPPSCERKGCETTLSVDK